MLPDLRLNQIIDDIEECAFLYKQYGIEIQAALQCIGELWAAGDLSVAGKLPFEEFSKLIKNLARNRSGGERDRMIVNYEFYYNLERVLGDFFAKCPSISPIEGLQVAIKHYEKIIHPQAFALLEALAKQSDLEHSKREREGLMREIAEFSERGLPLPEKVRDVAGFGAARFAHLAEQIPRGQSILDFYILNQIRYLLSRSAPSVIERMRDTGVPRNIFFGSLELRTPGAEIMPVEGADEYLIVLSRALWSATSLATGIITRCVELDPALPAPVNFDKHAAAQLSESLKMLDGILRCESLEFEFAPLFDERRKQFWELMDNATKQFIFGHEYAHLLLGHIGPSSRRSEDTAHAWNEELMADITALKLILTDMQARETRIAEHCTASFAEDSELISAAGNAVSDAMKFHVASGTALVLYMFWRMEALHGRNASLAGSHPPFTFRLGCMWTFLRMNFDRFEKIFRFSNLMLRDFMSLLPALDGTWRDRFQECAFGPLLLYPPEAVVDTLEKVNVAAPLINGQLESKRRQLEKLFGEPGTAYEEKYSVLEECTEMVRLYQVADPLRSARESLRARE